jgi:multidrug efflux pump subunit AcrB
MGTRFTCAISPLYASASRRDRSIRLSGDPTVGFGVVAHRGQHRGGDERGSNELAYLNAIYADKGIQFEQVYDETDYIYDAVSLVTENVYEASLLTVIVLLFSCAASAVFWSSACRSRSRW